MLLQSCYKMFGQFTLLSLYYILLEIRVVYITLCHGALYTEFIFFSCQKEHHPGVYRHVKSHGGKKSQLSSFLEEVCTDIEAEMGRGAPILQKPVEDESSKENEGGVKDKEKCSTGETIDKKQQDEQDERASSDKTKVGGKFRTLYYSGIQHENSD